jgi:hypothetical protein
LQPAVNLTPLILQLVAILDDLLLAIAAQTAMRRLLARGPLAGQMESLRDSFVRLAERAPAASAMQTGTEAGTAARRPPIAGRTPPTNFPAGPTARPTGGATPKGPPPGHEKIWPGRAPPSFRAGLRHSPNTGTDRKRASRRGAFPRPDRSILGT